MEEVTEVLPDQVLMEEVVLTVAEAEVHMVVAHTAAEAEAAVAAVCVAVAEEDKTLKIRVPNKGLFL